MNDAEVKKKLADYLEGDLSLEDRALVDAHLERNPELAREVAELEQTIRLLRSMPEPETPPMIAANVMRRIRAGETRPGFFERLRRVVTSVLEPSFMLPASAVAAAALVVVAIQDPGRFGFAGPDAPTSAVVGEPVAALEASAPLPLTAMAANAVPAPASTSSVAPGPAAARARFGAPANVERSRHVFAGAAPPTLVLRATPRSVTGGSVDVRNQAVPVAGPIPLSLSPMGGQVAPDVATDALHAGGEDPRDAWIALGLERPGDFARFLSTKTLAEQELWVARLAGRADARGLLDELVQALEATPEDVARVLAADLEAEARQLRAEAR